MERTTTRCWLCPAAQKKTHKNILMHPLFVEEAVDGLPNRSGEQEASTCLA
jgi:hypothetical protein